MFVEENSSGHTGPPSLIAAAITLFANDELPQALLQDGDHAHQSDRRQHEEGSGEHRRTDQQDDGEGAAAMERRVASVRQHL